MSKHAKKSCVFAMVTPVAKFKHTPTPPTHKEALIHVLHVDDEVGLLTTTKQILEAIGPLQVETASSVKEAMKKLEETKFDVIVSDYQMPEKNGLDFLRELRENGNNIPLILFTGKGREEIAIEALNLGASRYCNKNGNPQTVYGELSHSIQQIVEKRNSEEALRQERETLEIVTQNIGTGLTIISKDYHILWANRVVKDVFADAEGKICYSTYHQRTSVCPGCGVKEILETGKNQVVHQRVVKDLDGQNIWLENITTPIRDENGNITAALELSLEITERKRAEEQLKESEEKYRKQFEEALGAIFLADAETGIIVDCNRAATELVGWTKSELIGKHQRIIHPPEETEGDFSRTFEQHLKEKEGQVLETQVITKTGEIRDVAVKATIFEVGNRRILQGTFRDITERKRAEEKLRQSEQRYRTVFENTGTAMCILEEDTTISVVNRRFEELSGYSREEVEGKKWTDFVTEEYLERMQRYHEARRKRGGKAPKHYSFDFVNKMGQTRNALLTITLIPRTKKSVVSILDITESKKAENALRESAEKYRDLINAMNDKVWVIDFDSKFIDVNDAAVKVLGYSRDELLSMGPQDIDNTLPAEEIKALIKGMKTAELQVFETAHTTKDGKKIPVEISSSRVTYQGKPAILSISRNITERKLLEKALQNSEERFMQVAENAVEWIWEVDADGLYTYSSPAVEKLLGYKPEEIVGKKHFYDMFPPEDQESLKKAAFSAFNGKQSFRDFINRNVHKNGNVVWLSTSGVPTVDNEGKLVGYRGADVDITDRKKAEDAVDTMVNELEKVIEKLRVVGKATRHDARNKLAVIANNVYLAKQRLTGGPNASEYLDAIESTIEQIEKIFDFARTYEMIGVEERSYVNVEKSVEEAVIFFSGLGGTKLESECCGLTVLADSQLRQLFYNLIDNSLKHGEKVTKIRVYCEEKEDLLKLIYEDNGVGIPENEKEIIYKEGYGKGTGYGLYLIQKMCESYGWTIQETGKLGEGAQFTITVPKKNVNWKRSHQLQ